MLRREDSRVDTRSHMFPNRVSLIQNRLLFIIRWVFKRGSVTFEVNPLLTLHLGGWRTVITGTRSSNPRMRICESDVLTGVHYREIPLLKDCARKQCLPALLEHTT